jgi:uncharacterized membrane protein YgcG
MLSSLQVAVALMKNMEVQPGHTAEDTAATFAADLFENWGIGSKHCSNGVLLLLSTGDRQVMNPSCEQGVGCGANAKGECQFG